MKTLFSFILILSGFLALAGDSKLQVGDRAEHTSVKMLDVSGEKLSLDDVRDANGLVVIFSSNTCPFVKKWEGRYNGLKQWADDHDVGLVVLNSNYNNRNGVDSYEAMQQHAKEQAYNFPYLVDKNSLLANAFGGQTTPHVFLFDKDYKLVYKGAIDDNYDDASRVKKAYLKAAIHSLVAGEAIAESETKPVGCSIKRKLD
ncbi:thioredoxin family protein [uncultured Sunxiuqinia sp.]|uniref:thioredoxin family protein n=1 Tax=uncultured Sunxiuqinia sp. TaxID=1573825 RepID=UPI002617DB5B|nr:thioredoxin family protein [uncultured Sunxiuqinia sp.]